MYLYRHQVRKGLGEATVVWINPRRIAFHAGTNQPYTNGVKQALHRLEESLPVVRPVTRRVNSALYSLEPFRIRASRLARLSPVEAVETYRKVADAIACREDPSRSVWFGEMMAELQQTGVAVHKAQRFGSEAEVRAFFARYVGGLIDSMATGGYDMTRAEDTGTAMVAADGTILKSDAGNHRFSVARILGVQLVPLEILGAHEDWIDRMGIGRDLGKLKAGLRQVEAENR